MNNNATEPSSAVSADEATSAANAELSARCAERALTLGKNVIDKYLLKSKYENSRDVIFAEKLNTKNGIKTGTSSVWHYTSAIAMTGALAKISGGEDKQYFTDLYADSVASLQFYSGTAKTITYNGTPELTMYAVDRAAKAGKADITGIKAVYDDQMWIVRDLVRAFDRTGDGKYLDEAIRLADVCIGGWDTTKKSNGNEYGGIPWGPGYSTKHTCSNAPLIAPLVRIYEILNEKGADNAKYYLDWAEKIYKFCLRFENDDGTFGDLVGSERKTVTEDGVTRYVTTTQSAGIDHSAYTYNTGTMISGGAALYRATGLEEYKNSAAKWAKASYRVFTKKGPNGEREYTSKSTLWFNLILLEGFLELAPYDSACGQYIDTFLTSLDYAYDNHLNKYGLLPRDYLAGWDMKNGDDVSTSIMDQAADAEIYALMSEYYGK